MLKTFLKKIPPSVAVILSLVLLVLIYPSPQIEADTTSRNLSGYAWSSNIGWISMNCENENVCGTSDYRVSVDGNGNLIGYAWSPNIGWVKFGGLSGFPPNVYGQSSVSGGHNARINFTTGKMSGMARAVTPLSNPSPGANGYQTLGYWDGWIALDGVTTPNSGKVYYGVQLESKPILQDDEEQNFTGYAWGGDVIGWINWGATNGFGGVSLETYDYLIRSQDVINIQSGATVDVPIVIENVAGNPELISMSWVTFSPNQGMSFSFPSGSSCEPNTGNPRTCEIILRITANTNPGIKNLSIGALSSSNVARSGYFQVLVSNQPEPPPPPPPPTDPIEGSCSVNSSGPYLINQEITFSVNHTGGVAPYEYVWDLSPVYVPVTLPNSPSVNVRFLTIGTKNIAVQITDSEGSSVSLGCASDGEQSVRIQVNPTFQEQ